LSHIGNQACQIQESLRDSQHHRCKSVASLKVLASRSTCHFVLQPGQQGLVILCLYTLARLPYNARNKEAVARAVEGQFVWDVASVGSRLAMIWKDQFAWLQLAHCE
jgi:hypothetical protein